MNYTSKPNLNASHSIDDKTRTTNKCAATTKRVLFAYAPHLLHIPITRAICCTHTIPSIKNEFSSRPGRDACALTHTHTHICCAQVLRAAQVVVTCRRGQTEHKHTGIKDHTTSNALRVPLRIVRFPPTAKSTQPFHACTCYVWCAGATMIFQLVQRRPREAIAHIVGHKANKTPPPPPPPRAHTHAHNHHQTKGLEYKYI